MCGITGFWGGTAPSAAIAESMACCIKTRGPDDAGVWLDECVDLALAHRRLSILDLSPAGHQPMLSTCKRYVLVFNGEIYNHQDLRVDLKVDGCRINWRGHSDTETLLAVLSHWGVMGGLQRLNGMFAFALWDAQEHTLFLARDRMGEKPLYYGRIGNTFLFGSELKALAAHPDWFGEVNRDALALYMRYSYVPAPMSIYRGISKLPPAHFVAIREGGCAVGNPQCYWDLGKIAEQCVDTFHGKPELLIDELDSLLLDAVGRRMAADVPLGAFLSGGYDSTTVAAMMQAQSERPVKTFTIGFLEEGYNEAKHAEAVAKHLGTDHTELYVTPEEAMAVIPKLPSIYDEPFADSSQIPTFLVSELASRHVTVSLSGDGGDELFFGYYRYIHGYRIQQKLRIFSPVFQRMIARMLSHAPSHLLDNLQRQLPQRFQISNLSDRLPKFADLLAHTDEVSFYQWLVSIWRAPGQFVKDASEPLTILSDPDHLPGLTGLRERMMYLDMMTYLPDDILTKVDRASMAVSLEARVPMLDHRMVEFAWRVPTDFKFREGQGKWLLRQVLDRYVPRKLMERPKMGFGVPIEHWLRGPLREWADELMSEKRLREEGFFDPVPIRKKWEEHVSGKRRWHNCLWVVLMFQAWLEKKP